MNHVPERSRPLVIAATAIVVLLLVAGGVLLIGRLGPSPAPSTPPPPSMTASPSADASTPEGATRAFFEAYAQARQSDDPSLVEPYVTSRTSSAYLSAAAFLRGQKESGKASVTTVLRIENVNVEQSGTTATVSFDYTEGGYNIDPTSGSPVESPTVLPTVRVVATVRQSDGRWLVDSYHTQ